MESPFEGQAGAHDVGLCVKCVKKFFPKDRKKFKGACGYNNWKLHLWYYLFIVNENCDILAS